MATKSTPLRRSPGRPLPASDPAALGQPRRLSSMVEVGSLLRAERAARRLTQAAMAAQLGIGRQTLIALESGAEGASAGMVLRILTDLGVTIVALPAAAGDPESAPEPGVISP